MRAVVEVVCMGGVAVCDGVAGEAAAVLGEGGGFQNRPKYPLTFANP